MDSQTIFNWIQTVTGLAVLVGLGLVIWELQQNREAMQSQLTSDGWQMLTNRNASVLGESPAEALAKGCEAPSTLTAAGWISTKINHSPRQILESPLGLNGLGVARRVARLVVP